MWSVEWITGTTRAELTIEERAIFVDFLALASLGRPPGAFKFFSIDDLARQLAVNSQKLSEAINRMISVGKIKIIQNPQRIKLVKWHKYQRLHGGNENDKNSTFIQEFPANKVTYKKGIDTDKTQTRQDTDKTQSKFKKPPSIILPSEGKTNQYQKLEDIPTPPGYTGPTLRPSLNPTPEEISAPDTNLGLK